MPDAEWPKYSGTQRALHWLTALLVLPTLAAGLMLWWLGYEGTVATFGQATTNMIYKYHKTFGVIILALMVVRIIVKMRSEKPPYANPLSDFERIASNSVHGLLYVALIAQPALGWLATGASGFPVEFFGWNLPPLIGKDKELGATLYQLHGLVGFALVLLIGAHIGGAMMHGVIKRDGVLQRML